MIKQIQPPSSLPLADPCGDSRSSQLFSPTQQQVAELLDQYAMHLDQGDENAAAQLLAAHPELNGTWNQHIESLQRLCRATRKVESSEESRPREQVEDSSTLGDYRLNREIGRGGMGIVYEATQLSLRRSVALKILPFAAVLDNQQVARFRNEAQAAASLHHPHIVPVFAVGCERGVHYYSMQLIDGRTLEQVFIELSQSPQRTSFDKFALKDLSRVHNQTTLDAPQVPVEHPLDATNDRGQRTVPQVGKPTQVNSANQASTVATVRTRSYIQDTVGLIICVAEALDFAHNQGVIHRDIKPSNLLLDSTGKIWVADFGLARVRGLGNLTAEGKVMGSARYMSPEQIAGRPQGIDHRTDIYSLGITLYELLTLQPAFADANRELLFRTIENAPPVSPKRLNPAVTIDLETIILKAIAKNKEERYATAGEMADDLRRFLDGKPTLARRPTPLELAFKWAVRRQGLVGSGLVLLLLAVLGLSAATLLIARESRAKDRAMARAILHLDQAHALVDRFGGLLTRRLADVPGTEGLRIEILREAERYYLDFLQYADQDVSLRGDLAKVQFRLAAIYGVLGDLELAEQNYQAAKASYQLLQRQPKLNADTQADFALCLHNLATLQKDRGRHSEAMDNYQSALHLQESLLDLPQASSRYLQEWAMTQNNWGLLLWQCADSRAAANRLRTAQSRLTEYLENTPNDLEVRRQLVECRNSLVAICIDDDLDQAEWLLRANIADLQSMLQSTSQAPEEQANEAQMDAGESLAKQLAISQNNLANVLGRQGHSEAGLQVVRGLIASLEDRIPSVSSDPDRLEQIAIAHNNLGQLLWSRSAKRDATATPAPTQDASEKQDDCENDATLSAFMVAERCLRTQIERLGPRPELLSRLAGVLHNLGMVQQNQGLEVAAIDYLTEALELQAQAIKQVPFHQGYRGNLEKHRELLDHVLSQFKDSRKSDSPPSSAGVLPSGEAVDARNAAAEN